MQYAIQILFVNSLTSLRNVLSVRESMELPKHVIILGSVPKSLRFQRVPQKWLRFRGQGTVCKLSPLVMLNNRSLIGQPSLTGYFTTTQYQWTLVHTQHSFLRVHSDTYMSSWKQGKVLAICSFVTLSMLSVVSEARIRWFMRVYK